MLRLKLLPEDLLAHLTWDPLHANVCSCSTVKVVFITSVIIVTCRTRSLSRVEQLVIEIFLFLVEPLHLFDLIFKVVKLGHISFQDADQVLQTLVLLIEGVHMLLQSLALLVLHLKHLVCLIKLLLRFRQLLLELLDLLCLFLISPAHLLQSSVILFDNLLELFMRKLIHTGQTERDLFCGPGLSRLTDAGVTLCLRYRISIFVFLLELLLQLLFKLVEHFDSSNIFFFTYN